MKVKKTIVAGLIAMSLPVIAMATPLTIVNNTNQDSTSIINNGMCSNALGPSGITRAHQTNVVPDVVLQNACFFTPENCRADIYMTNNCTGPKVATAMFSLKRGITGITGFTPNYALVMNGSFGLIMNSRT